MKKEVIRREAIKLILKDRSYKEVRKILKEEYDYSISIKQLRRWERRFNQTDWDFKDYSQRPNRVYYKFSLEDRELVTKARKKTGFSSYQLKSKIEEKGISISESTIKRIIKGDGLSRGNKMEGQRLKWVRFERNNPNSMWQLDGTQFRGIWLLPIIDDCSRYCLAIGKMIHMTTDNVIALLEESIGMHGKPRELLTDNGPEYGGRSIHSDFDKWCNKQGIKHIRSGVHKPTTVGKIGRLQYTIVYELPFCYEDLEYFRYRYNCERPHRSLNGLTPNQVYLEWTRHKKYLLDKKKMVEGI